MTVPIAVKRDHVAIVSPHDPVCDELSQEVSNLDLVEHPIKPIPSIRTLPIELLIVIFTLVLARDHATVVVLAQICQDLRHLVVSTPSLWSTLSLSSNKPLQKAALWTSRNQGLLRGLYIREWDDDIAKTLASMIQVPLDNLRTLSVNDFNFCELKMVLPSLTPKILSHLETLTLRHTEFDSGWFDGLSVSHLRTLDVHSTTLDWAQVINKTTELRHLSYIEPPVREPAPDFPTLLQRNSHMRSLTLQGYAWSNGPNGVPDIPLHPPPSLNSRIELAHLSSLTLTALKLGFLVPFVSLPNLRFLQLENMASDRHWTEITSNLIEARAAEKLVSLAIVYALPGCLIPNFPHDFPEMLTQLLRGASRLKYLEIFMVPFIETVLHALTDDPQAYCPRLTSLDVSQCFDVDDELLVGVVKARNSNDAITSIGSSNTSSANSSTPTATKLHTLVANSCRQVTEDGLRWLREHVPHVTCHYERTRRQRTERQRRLDAAYWRES